MILDFMQLARELKKKVELVMFFFMIVLYISIAKSPLLKGF